MKVCVVTDGLPPHCGGLPLIAYERARGLQSFEDVEVILIAWIFREVEKVKEDGFPSYVYPLRLRYPEFSNVWKPWRPLKLALFLFVLCIRLGRLLFQLRSEFDLVYAVGASTWSSLISIPIAKVLKKPVVVEMALLGDDDPLSLNRRGNAPEQQLFPHRPLRYSLFLKADAYVSISHGLSESYRQAGLPESKLFQIPYGVDTDRFKPPTGLEKRKLRHELRLEQESNIILFVGRITPSKGVRQLIAACKRLRDDFPETSLLIVGPNIPPDPEFMRVVRDDISKLNLTEQVTLVGVDKMVENVADFMRAADIFCLPSEREGLGLVTVEAMASGLPVVVSRLEGVTTEFIDSGRDGFLVPVGCIAELADALAQLLEDVRLRKRIGDAARERAVSEFSLDRYYLRHLSLYERLLADRRVAG